MFMCMPEHRRKSWIEVELYCIKFKLFGFYLLWIRVVNISLFLFRMDNTKVYVIYELRMFVWFVLYYVT